MMRVIAALALSAIILASGCITLDTPTEGEPIQADDVPAVARDLAAALVGIPCAASVSDDATSANLLPLATDALDAVGPATDHAELDHFGDFVYVARHGTGGIDVVNVSDPLAPRHVTFWDPDVGDRGLDVKALPDGSGVLAAGDRGIHVVNFGDLEAPFEESFLAFTQPQAHMITPFTVANMTYVAAMKGQGEDIRIYTVEGDVGARTLVYLTSVQTTQLGSQGVDLTRAHDAYFMVDPILKRPILWVANVWEGVVALDMSDPAHPTRVSRILPLDPYQGYTHTVRTTVKEERRITILVQEVGSNALKVYDTTDLEAPTLIGVWHYPVTAMPQHNMQLVGDLLYVAHYNQGMYVFNISTLPAAGGIPKILSPVAHLAAAADGAVFSGYWDVIVRSGVIYVSNIARGLEVVGFGCITPGDAAATSAG